MLTTPVAYISAHALRHNLACVRKLAPNARVMAMVKANAYGHGLVQVATVLVNAGVDALGVARLQEGITLRQAGINIPLVLLSGVLDSSELALAHRHQLDIVIHTPSQLTLLAASNLTCRVWLKINTGMNRLGIALIDAITVYETLRASPHEIVGIMSHFAGAEEPDGLSLRQQLDKFRALTDSWPYPKSMANSAALIAHPETHFDWVRPGIMLYGISPFAGKTGADLGLMPVMRLVAPLGATAALRQGERVGYNGLFTCPEDMPIGIVRIGYGDGYPRYLRQPAYVLINQRRALILGRVSMDLLAIDLRHQDAIPLGTPVELWGPDLPVEHLAQAAETSPYELVAGLTARVSEVMN